MSGHSTVRAVFAIVVSLLMDGSGAEAAGPTASPPGQVLEVTATPSRVSLMARETPLADVKAIGQQAGVKIVLRSEFNTPVTATLANVPLDEAIRRLSRWHSVLLIYDPCLVRPQAAEGT